MLPWWDKMGGKRAGKRASKIIGNQAIKSWAGRCRDREKTSFPPDSAAASRMLLGKKLLLAQSTDGHRSGQTVIHLQVTY